MFRIAQLLNIARSHIYPTVSLFAPSTLYLKNVACFSTTPPTKIIEMIEDENLFTKLDAFAQQISLLDESIKQQVIDTLIQKIREEQLLPTIIQHQKIREQFKKYPSQYFEVYFLRVQQSIEKLKQLMQYQEKRMIKLFAKEINDSFVVCFDVLKKLEGKDAIIKELKLLRTFATYNFKYLSELVETNKCLQVMNKGKQSYRALLSKLIQAINKLKEDENNLRKEIDANPTEEKKKQLQSQLKLFQQAKQIWVEEYAQVVQEMIDNEEELQQQRKEQGQEGKTKNPRSRQTVQFEFLLNDEILALEPYIQKAVKNYQKVPHIYIQSNYLYKFKKLLIQIGNQKQMRVLFNSRMNQKEKELRLKQLQQQMIFKLQALYEEGENALKMMSTNEKLTEQDLARFIMDLFQTTTHRFVEDEQTEVKFKLQFLGKEIQKLVNHIPNESLRKKVLGLLMKMIKEELGIKLESFVQKLPRSARTQRRS